MPDASTTQLENLLVRLRAGDVEARRQLIERSCARLQQLTRRLLREFPRLHRWVTDEDVLQDAVIRLMRSLQEVTPSSVAGYFGLAAREIRRALIDLVRRYYGPGGTGAGHASGVGGVDSEGAPQPLPQLAESTYQPDKLAAWTEFHRQVELLPEEERQAFDHLWYHELSLDDAAAAIGTSLATLKRRWLSARLKLQERCKDIARIL